MRFSLLHLLTANQYPIAYLLADCQDFDLFVIVVNFVEHSKAIAGTTADFPFCAKYHGTFEWLTISCLDIWLKS